MAEKISGNSAELQIRLLFANGDAERGMQVLDRLVAETAGQRRFEEAEYLRNLLIELNPTALGNIIRTGELIEREKSATVDKNFITAWPSLQKTLDPEEFSSLYHRLEHKQYARNDLIAVQGSSKSILCFVNIGKVELFYTDQGKDVVVKAVSPGEIFGAETFFEPSVWTVGARSLGALASILDRNGIATLENEFPGLESKLRDLSGRFKIPASAFVRTGNGRRLFQRFRVSGRIDLMLFDRDGNASGNGASGDLFDISAGGVSLLLRIAKKDNVRKLFKKIVGLTMKSKVTDRFGITGDVVAVRSQLAADSEYAVSIQFSRQLAGKELHNILAVAAVGNGGYR